ncbi:MAG: 3-oxoacyl-[acyl-carrier-protein] reductase [Acidobacteriota bacterium]
MFSLENRTALVTGASQGIGEIIARQLAAAGARVVVAARSTDKLEALASAIEESGGAALPLQLDVGDPDAVAAQLKTLKGEWGDIDIAVSNAGITRDSLYARLKLDDWRSVLDVNLTGAFAVTKPLIRGMMRRRFGRIIFISSVIGLMGNTGQANYAASKAGLVGLAKSLAKELGGRNITANVVAPGFIETAMTADLEDGVKNQLAESIALGRFGKAQDIAAPVLFLASEEAGYITGEVLNVSGGLYM